MRYLIIGLILFVLFMVWQHICREVEMREMTRKRNEWRAAQTFSAGIPQTRTGAAESISQSECVHLARSRFDLQTPTKTEGTALRSSAREPHAVANALRGREALGIDQSVNVATSNNFPAIGAGSASDERVQIASAREPVAPVSLFNDHGTRVGGQLVGSADNGSLADSFTKQNG